MNFATTDYVIFALYFATIVFIGLWMSREKKGHEKNAEDYFLASKALPWWAIGSSLIASNISAEQFIGMSGSGYAIGLGIASYEWMAAITLILVGKFFLPIFLKKEIYTMPQFLEIRYDKRVRTSLAVFWLLVYVFVNLTSVLYLGALSLETIMGIDLIWGIIGLGLFSALYSIYGGLKAVAWTDVIQVVFLIGGGLVTTVLALQAVGAGDLVAGFTQLVEKAPDKFDMILSPDSPNYSKLPGIGVLLGGMWIANLFYWGCNQYITQRALAAKDIKQAQRGLIFAGFLKILMPVIVVIPGIAAYVLLQSSGESIGKPDEAYPWLVNKFVPLGLKGAVVAALVAAIVSSLSSMMNSTATIFSMDLYKEFFNKNASEKNLVTTGRVTATIALVVGMFIAPQLANLDQAFQYIQEYTGFISPGILAVFLFGLFWKKATTESALTAAVLTIPLGILFKFVFPDMAFLDRMGIIFLLISAQIVVMSLLQGRGDDKKSITMDKGLFATDSVFNVSSIIICAILAVLYILYW